MGGDGGGGGEHITQRPLSRLHWLHCWHTIITTRSQDVTAYYANVIQHVSPASRELSTPDFCSLHFSENKTKGKHGCIIRTGLDIWWCSNYFPVDTQSTAAKNPRRHQKAFFNKKVNACKMADRLLRPETRFIIKSFYCRSLGHALLIFFIFLIKTQRDVMASYVMLLAGSYWLMPPNVSLVLQRHDGK